MFALAATPLYATSARYGLKTYGPYETAGTTIATTDGVWIYGWSIFADASSSFAGIKDCDTTAEINDHSTYPLDDEIGEATQYDSQTKWFAKPIYFSEGLGIALSEGTVFVYYGPPPQ